MAGKNKDQQQGTGDNKGLTDIAVDGDSDGDAKNRHHPRLAVTDEATSHEHLTIVGIGASAGGLEAFSQLLRAMPESPGLAIVLVQHMAPHHESALATLLT